MAVFNANSIGKQLVLLLLYIYPVYDNNNDDDTNTTIRDIIYFFFLSINKRAHSSVLDSLIVSNSKL